MVWHDGGEPDSMQASPIRVCWHAETMPWVWKLHGAVCAPEVGYLIRCLAAKAQEST